MSDESCGLGTAWWTSAESEGSVHSCQTPWMQDTPRATEQTCHCVRLNEVASKTGRVVETDCSGSSREKKSQSLLAYVADLARDQHRQGGRVF